MRCCVEYHLGLVLGKYLCETLCIAHIGNNGRKQKIGMIIAKLKVNLKNTVLTMPEQDKLSGITPCDLTA
jgi:hypothetical protein